MRCQRQSASSSASWRAWPVWSSPVTFGGGEALFLPGALPALLDAFRLVERVHRRIVRPRTFVVRARRSDAVRQRLCAQYAESARGRRRTPASRGNRCDSFVAFGQLLRVTEIRVSFKEVDVRDLDFLEGN